MTHKYVDGITGTDDTTVARGDTANFPYKTLQYAIDSVREKRLAIHLVDITDNIIIMPDKSVEGIYNKTFS
jgi:hypothetical protein